MKAERRHDLKTNTLSKGLENAPAFFQQYGSRILLGVILCLLVYILVQNHMRDKADKAQNAAKSLGGALYSLNELRHIPTVTPQGQMVSPDQLVAFRNEYSREIETSLTEVMANTDDPKMLAQAWIVRGDLNWQLANFPPLPGATTRPELNTPKTSEEYLSAAADAYAKVLQPPLNEDHESVTSARFGLAYVAENRAQWDKARDYFQQVADDPGASKAFQNWARSSLDELKNLAKPAFTGAGTSEVPGNISTEPFTITPFSPTTAPSTQPSPATQPSPSSAPATQPTVFPSTEPFNFK